ncbi:hypothetical protein EJ07DRAFT_126872, partial [Lizonia empirigonia]
MNFKGSRIARTCSLTSFQGSSRWSSYGTLTTAICVKFECTANPHLLSPASTARSQQVPSVSEPDMPTHRTLAIHPAPFKPSYLSIPASPFSPCSPLTPAPKPRKQAQNISLSEQDTSTLPVPSTPIKWVWTCHACARAYPLGATRRCLDDGHAFCAGTTVVKSWRTDGPRRRVKKHRACASEFDYAGWKTWGRWRRSVSSTTGNPLGSKPARLIMLDKNKPKNCWTDCDYPSHCR